jgi:hypothetical protein
MFYTLHPTKHLNKRLDPVKKYYENALHQFFVLNRWALQGYFVTVLLPSHAQTSHKTISGIRTTNVYNSLMLKSMYEGLWYPG